MQNYGLEDLVKLGIREDDGIKFTKGMFNSSKLIADIGKYITVSFEEGILEHCNRYWKKWSRFYNEFKSFTKLFLNLYSKSILINCDEWELNTFIIEINLACIDMNF